MKLLFTTILTLAVIFGTYAQRFEVVDNSKNLKAEIGEKVLTPITIKNLTDAPLNLVIRRVDQAIGSSQNSFFCLDGKCFDSEMDQLPVPYLIPAGETSLAFESVMETGLAEGISSVKYIIYDRNHPTEAVEVDLSYTVAEKKEKNIIYDSDKLKLNDVYPNPVTEFAIIDYNIINNSVDAKIIIHNVLGSVMGEYQLPYLENKVTIKTEDFNPGVYFYTLYVDNDGVLTRKLIIRK